MSAQQSRTCCVHAACIRGVEARPVTVEVSMAGGIPGISLVGMADAAVMEARVRIRCALRAGGFDLPRKNIVVNLSPADMRKTGSGFDLPILVAILALSGQIPSKGLDECLFVGELGLDGAVLPVRGEVAYSLLARDSGLTLVCAPASAPVWLDGFTPRYLGDTSTLVLGVMEATKPGMPVRDVPPSVSPQLDYADVVGQEVAKRGLAIAAAGDLGLLMIGAPGSGKTMLASRVTSILPPIEPSEQQEALCIHSVAGERLDDIIAGRRPFRNPHHSVSAAGLVGGGRPVRPGEISLAHGGVLYLDELAEFSANVLQTLRQPLEEGSVRIVRADGVYAFPSRFQLIASSNPCPCGHLGDPDVPCRCSDAAVSRYRSKLGGPLADRIDIILDVARPEARAVVEGSEGASSADLRVQVERGRRFAEWRASHADDPSARDTAGSDVEAGLSDETVSSEAKDILLQVASRRHLSARGISRLVRISRTIADMEESPLVQPPHVLEGSMFQGRRDEL